MMSDKKADGKKTSVYVTYAYLTSFFWRSKLSMERKEKIVAWVNSLDDDARSMLNDIIDDTSESTQWEADYQNNQ
jgi:hypothetical protein